MAVGERTIGTQVSEYPTTLAAFIAQTETNDPVVEDPDIAEGRDANKWSAELAAIQAALGLNGQRGVIDLVSSGPPVIDVGAFDYILDGFQVGFGGATGFALAGGVASFVWVDMDTATLASGTSFPTSKRIILLASVDDSVGPPAVVTDLRSPGLAAQMDLGDVLAVRPDMRGFGPLVANPTGEAVVGHTFPAAFGGDATVQGGAADAGSGSFGGSPILRMGAGDGAGGDGPIVLCVVPGAHFTATIVRINEEVLSGSGATLTTSGLIPFGTILLGITTRVRTADGGGGGAVSMDIGDGTDVDRFGAGISLAAATTTELGDHTGGPTDIPAMFTAVGGDVTLTANGGTFDAIEVLVSAHILFLFPAVS